MCPLRPRNVGTCRLEDVVGQGGMAEVFRGYQETLERPVAIKALLQDFKDDELANERFRREALALAALHHENIVAVYDLVEKYNRMYLIMEYVDGVDLATVLKKGPVSIDIGLLIGSALSNALEHAHFRKVIHRDVKPANVMLSRTGQVKLTDFGIAKDQTMDDLTRQGFVVGTMDYLSPEQIGGSRADWRSDLYALGVTLFEALSGVKPHRGDDQSDLLGNIIHGRRKRLREVAPQLPRAIERVTQRCLELDPAKRYQRAAELRHDLDRLLSAVLQGTRSARLVAFLRDHNLVGEIDDTLIASEELASAKPVPAAETVLHSQQIEQPRQAGGLVRLRRVILSLLVALFFVACSVTATYLVAPEWTMQTLVRISTWLHGVHQSARESIQLSGDESPRGGQGQPP